MFEGFLGDFLKLVSIYKLLIRALNILGSGKEHYLALYHLVYTLPVPHTMVVIVSM